MNKFFRNIFILITSFILLSAISIISVLWTYSNDLPDYKFLKSYKPPVSSKVYSGNGDLVADFSQEKRVFVPFNSIPKNVINAFLSAEDKNFFKHPGVDAKGVIRALITPLASTPGCLKKFLSSADKNALITFFGIELNGTNTLFSCEKSATKSPLPE